MFNFYKGLTSPIQEFRLSPTQLYTRSLQLNTGEYFFYTITVLSICTGNTAQGLSTDLACEVGVISVYIAWMC